MALEITISSRVYSWTQVHVKDRYRNTSKFDICSWNRDYFKIIVLGSIEFQALALETTFSSRAGSWNNVNWTNSSGAVSWKHNLFQEWCLEITYFKNWIWKLSLFPDWAVNMKCKSMFVLEILFILRVGSWNTFYCKIPTVKQWILY